MNRKIGSTDMKSTAERGVSACILAGLAGIVALGPERAFAGVPAGCQPTTDSEYKVTTLVDSAMGIIEPVKMDFDLVAKDQVDVYWVERRGKLKKFDAATSSVIELASLPTNTSNESGLTGILLDKAFKTNRRMYLYYAFSSGSAFEFRLSRYALGTDGKLDLASQKVILRIPATESKMHTGGAMAWGADGDLYLTVGENEADMGGPANTNDLRGKILRIRPQEDGTYLVPDGNLFAKGTERTRPEVFVMGNRNAYTLAYDPVLKGVVWGEIGPDGFGQTEEYNLAVTPGNYGWPMWSGNGVAIKAPADMSVSAPKNANAANTGLQDLPAARPGTFTYAQSCAITGPIYRYDGTLDTKRKWPPHWDGKWIVSDCNQNYLDSMNLAGIDGIASHGKFLKSVKVTFPLDLKFGPDGALYVLNYAGWWSVTKNTSIQRIEYTGSCLPASSALAESRRDASRRALRGMLRKNGMGLIPWQGLRTVDGRRVAPRY